ncbi:hypothetical protein FGIG_03418 [Fasciola gigantica]|uniref:Uncharacterized protein n=1 Tax=Fasciola gigantica TaxID=46835 RepID=A0A504Y9M3_FASGI|nr:hypothetical protein FGIG_03418 [Fasciola gigantica]
MPLIKTAMEVSQRKNCVISSENSFPIWRKKSWKNT